MQRPARPVEPGCIGGVVIVHVEHLGVNDFRFPPMSALAYARIIMARWRFFPEIPVRVRQFRPVTCGGGGFDFSQGNEREGTAFPRVAVFALAFPRSDRCGLCESVVSHSAVFLWSGAGLGEWCAARNNRL